ncbi:MULTISPECIES: 3D-(3,5/4)-trihydroxycyclohexane-1,2-dione acylhydrolase (decyclizing) [unclassified Streptomyces]|uniref:3D-(3,5/4)-trihydroxycyclohexane-1,2-dione acylhydrolase (decyclizing) n=1 Tax=unclassified Streptomyces TaxID=2593676 RepID=UPI0006AE94DC|nr:MULTISPECIES: 3D-(3,5/4)-trihydroxycyclohexane-1,2-dione acylhydrolase (decyclizing) [unclassified Streptomyces]KOX37219.1 3D-(3,5/4)-trihydroxycyclohexane-1,2-dione hydrolase [Streptomyces sp. NRRL F-6491]KOX40980.1 3D-(3,5/4)-trihydroxycyclohexane-1,2-dione hydrolase [Streptomyces sp. NRRL F-6492]
MSTVRLTTAQALVRFLAAQYTERDGERRRLIAATWGIFGHGNVAGIGQALVEQATRPGDPGPMPFHQGRNEQAMVHAAVGYARQSRRLSAHAVTTSIGPGATNLVTGAALATINRLPVLLLPGDTFATRPADPVLQQLQLPWAGDVSVNDCLRPVSVYFDRITRPEALVPAALEAVRTLADPAATGAVTLALPQDVQAEAYDWPEEFFAERTWRVRRPRPDAAELDAAVRAVRSAERPLVVAGGGVRHSGAEDALRTFAERAGLPVATTQAGKGVLPYDHPCDVGGVGHTGTDTAAALARTADLVIGVGTRYTDFTTASGTLFPGGARFLNLNITGFDAHKQAAMPLVADAREGLTALTGALGDHRRDTTRWAAAGRDWQERVDAAYAVPDEDARPTQTQVLGALDTLVDGSDILINAAGSLPGDLHGLWRPRSADQYHVEYGYSCMGYEIPAAIGVLLAAPGRPVWALVGDGTYLMNPTEIVTAVQERLPLRLVVLQNHGYASIGGLSEAVGAERYGTDYRYRDADGGFTGPPLPVDLGANAASLGMRVLRPRTVRDLREALGEARAATVPTCVYVETETPDTVSGPPPAPAWWDVPVAETSTRPSAVKAREEYDRHVTARRRHL